MSRRTRSRFGVLGILGIGFVLGYIVACSKTQPTQSVEASQTDNAKANEVPGNPRNLSMTPTASSSRVSPRFTLSSQRALSWSGTA